MANKRTETPEELIAETVEEELTAEPVEKEKAPKKKESAPVAQGEKKVTIRLPKQKDKGDMFVSVNERTFLVKRGVPVTVPESVAEVIATSERYEEEAEEFDEKVRKDG